MRPTDHDEHAGVTQNIHDSRHRLEKSSGFFFACAVCIVMIISTTAWGQVTLGTSPYSENFDSAGAGLPTGWTVRTGGTSSNLGTIQTLTTTKTSWANATGQFANRASADGLTSASDATAQSNSTDRVIAVRQTGSFGDPGAAFVLTLSNTTGLTNFALTFKAQDLDEQLKTTTWTVDYGLGAAPTSFNSTGVTVTPAAWGSVDITVNPTQLAGIANQSQPVQIRIVALSTSTGSSGSRDVFAIDDVSLSYTSITAVRLIQFVAAKSNNGVLLEWQTGYEVRNLGFYVYREESGKRTRITPSLVAGSALMVGQQTPLTAGYIYSWFDQLADLSTNATYWLEDVDLSGARTLHGPITPALFSSFRVGAAASSPLLTEVEQHTPSTGTLFNGWPAARYDRKSRVTSSRVIAYSTSKDQRAIAAEPGVKLAISKTGWYRVTQPELVAAGLDQNVNPSQLQLFANAQEVPIEVSGDGIQFSSSDYIEFFGHGLESTTDALQTYYLIAGNAAGKRIGNSSDSSLLSVPSGPQNFDYTIERRDRWIYYAALLNGEEENIFGHIVTTTPTSQNLPVNHLDANGGGQVTLELSLVGVSLEKHHVRVTLNGTEVGTVVFTNDEHPDRIFNLPASLLREGKNTVQLTALGGNTDTSLIDKVCLTYAHSYAAENNSLVIAIDGTATTRVNGFTNANIRAVDITDPANVQELTPAVSALLDGSFAADLRITDARPNQPHTLLIFADGQAGHPDSIKHNQPSAWAENTNGADYLIITSRDFFSSAQPLVQLRRSQGLAVNVIDVEDLYDEFSFGAHSPAAIRDFLQTTATSWTRKPHYVLLMGDASYDPKNYLGQGSADFVPSKLLDTAFMETASDDWLADFNGDGIADLAIGRLPVRSGAEAEAMVNKIVTYENTPADAQRGALLVSDKGFEGANDVLRQALPANLPVQIINRSGSDNATIHNQIISSINQGASLVNYLGHGSNGVWTGALLLSNFDAPALTNSSHLSLFVMMTCLNGYFQNAYNDSLSEALLRSPGGAVAVWASSGMTESSAQNAIDQAFYRQIFGQSATLGNAVRAAKQATGDRDVRRTWILFGDPAMRLISNAPTFAPATISGTVITQEGTPLEGVTVRLSGQQSVTAITDAQGNYHFDNVDTGNFYTVTPSLANYHFSPANRSFSLLADKTDAVFTATPDALVSVNAIDTSEYFVRQQYLDFLGREPDQGGFNYWSDQVNQCHGDVDCLRSKRIDVSAAFFMSQEFQDTGSFVYRLYKGALGRQLRYAEFSADRAQVVGGPTLEASKTAFANAFVERGEFAQRYQANTTAQSFVDALLQTVEEAGADLSSERSNLISRYNSGAGLNGSRSLVLREVVDNARFSSAVYNQSFVLMEYFGYLRREPEQGGYEFWLNVLDNGDRGNYRDMICSFITSTEYQRRFGLVVTRSNAECAK